MASWPWQRQPLPVTTKPAGLDTRPVCQNMDTVYMIHPFKLKLFLFSTVVMH